MNTRLPAAIELLEPRIAPASVLTFIDVDGDSVKITSTLGDLNAPGVATKVAGAVTGEQLTLLDLRDASFQGTTITTAVKRAAGGDGFVHIGRIDATGRDLAAVKIKGDLAVIDVGDADTSAASPALKLLDVRSMGRFGLSTQVGAGDLASDITGTLRVLKVAGDIVGASIFASGGAGGFDGRIGSATIGGSLIGGATLFSGAIRSTGDMGLVKIGRDVVGGAGQNSAGIQSDFGGIKSLTIRGSVFGGTGTYDAFVDAVTQRFGQINAAGAIGSISVGGSIVGSSGTGGGEIRGPVSIGSLKVGGSLIGGSAGFTVQISSGKLGKLTVGGSIIGGEGNQSGFVTGLSVGDVTVGGSVIGSSGNFSGSIFAGGSLPGSVRIGGDLRGGSGGNSGRVGANGVVGNVTIGGSLIGGSGFGDGVIGAGNGNLGAVKIGGDLIGGSISGTEPTINLVGAIQSGGRIASVTIGGSIIAGTDTSTVGTLTNSGVIRAQDDIGPIIIKGSLIGNEIGALQQVIISARGQKTLAPNATTDLAIKSVTIGGHVELAKILGGFERDDADDAGSNGNASIGAVKVRGDWIASSVSAGINAGDVGLGIRGFGIDGSVINTPPGAAADAIVARIASIAIKGAVIGAPGFTFQTGFTAQQIGSFKSGAYTAPLTADTDPSILLTPYTVNVNILEV